MRFLAEGRQARFAQWARSMLASCRAVVTLSAVLIWAAGSAVAQVPNPIRIGFSIPLTGGLASNGRAILATYQMWQDDINASGGLLGRKVEFIYYDDQSNPALVPAIYAKLLDVDRIDLVIASYGTNMTLPLMPVVVPKKMVVMSLFSLAINDEFKYPNYFSMFPVGSDGVREISRGFFEIAKDQNLQTVAIIGADSDFAKKAADGARDNALSMGFKIVYERSYPPSMVDFSPILRGIQASNPDLVYVASYPTDSAGIVRAANEIRLRTKLFGGAMVGLQYGALKTQLGGQLNNIIVHDFYVPEPTLQFPGIEAFLKRYQAMVVGAGMDPLGYFVPPFAYANLQILGQAVQAIGSLDQAKLGEFLRSHRFTTIVGDVKYAPNGEWEKPRVLHVQFQGVAGHDLDQFKKAGTQTIIYPRNLASGTLRYPYFQ
jgi:branched-chain amino acid transport system substrate-binding protein